MQESLRACNVLLLGSVEMARFNPSAMSISSRFLKTCLFSLVFTIEGRSAPFVMPAEENPPFRLDKLPIDTDSMVSLSKSLTFLPGNTPLTGAAERRAAAQSLALALALDPANSAAREQLASLADGGEVERVKPAALTRATAKIWHFHAWLSTPEAGEDGNSLAGLISDTAAYLDPTHPGADALRKNELGDWNDWVAPLSAFEETKLAANDTDPFADIEPDEMENTPAKTDTGLAVRLTNAKVGGVLFGKTPTETTASPRPTMISLSATGGEELPFDLITPLSSGMETTVAAPVLAALKEIHGGLPEMGGLTLSIDNPAMLADPRNHANLTGPALVLANAALTGKPSGATVIGRIGAGNKIVLPDYFWRHLTALDKGPGGRLVLPANSEEFLSALLAFENPEFFLKYEVLTATTTADFFELSSAEQSEKNAEISARFAEIRDKAPASSVGSYLANRFVRQRLEEIVAEAPHHASARMLAIQGSGERPRTPSREILASEIWRAVDPIHTTTEVQIGLADPAMLAGIDKIYETSKAEVDRLERYADIRDRDLIEKARTLTGNLRSLSRALRSRDSLGEKYQEVLAAHTELVAADLAFRNEFSRISGQPLKAEPTPPVPRIRPNRLPPPPVPPVAPGQ